MSALKNLFNERVAQELAIGKSQAAAVRIACEERGKRPMSAENSRRHCQRARGLMRRVEELRWIANDKAEEGLKVTRDWMLHKCYQIANPNLGLDEIRPSDQIAAVRLAAQITGNLAPEKYEHEVAASVVTLTDQDRARALKAFVSKTTVMGKAP